MGRLLRGAALRLLGRLWGARLLEVVFVDAVALWCNLVGCACLARELRGRGERGGPDRCLRLLEEVGGFSLGVCTVPLGRVSFSG